MFGNNSLIYPTLYYYNDYKTQTDNKKHQLYKLDWNKKEYSCHEIPHTSDDTDYLSALPEPYDSWTTDLIFSIPENYMAEIQRMAHTSRMEWTHRRKFDTMIREICLGPAIEYIWVIFRLLADCSYDIQTGYFDRRVERILIPYALAYKFWRNQTGHGLVIDHSKINELERKLEFSLYWVDDQQKTVDCITQFVSKIKQHEKLIDQDHTRKYSIKESTDSEKS